MRTCAEMFKKWGWIHHISPVFLISWSFAVLLVLVWFMKNCIRIKMRLMSKLFLEIGLWLVFPVLIHFSASIWHLKRINEDYFILTCTPDFSRCSADGPYAYICFRMGPDYIQSVINPRLPWISNMINHMLFLFPSPCFFFTAFPFNHLSSDLSNPFLSSPFLVSLGSLKIKVSCW